jgi:mycofactocin precursor peptide peptidase
VNGTLASLTWPEARRGAEGSVLAVPIGSTEQHGPHLPLSTDSDIAVALIAELTKSRRDVVAAPALHYGASGEHEGFAGTISIGQEALEAVLVELGRSASRTFARIVFVSTHGGNAATVTRATHRLRTESRNVVAWSPRWNGDAHAGRLETSIMLALRPDDVDVRRARAGNLSPIADLMTTLKAEGVHAASPNGVLGDPDGASAAEGRQLLAEAVEDLIKTMVSV